jgi:hypothetical protein
MADLERPIDLDAAERALSMGNFNFLRRGTDLSLSMSDARWRLDERTDDRLVFRAAGPADAPMPEAEPMILETDRIVRITWDQLPRQQQRSQIRFHLADGELWTFSGSVDAALLS